MNDSKIRISVCRLFSFLLFVISLSFGSHVSAQDSLQIPEAVLKVEQKRIANIAKASEAAVGVFGPDASGGGSGVVISRDGYALTNFHVVQGNGAFLKCTMPDGVLYDAVLVGIDPTGDVALIKLLGRDDFPVAVWGDSDDLEIGDFCFAVGNPFLLATNFQPTVTYGIVSGTHRYQYPSGTLLEYADCIQTDAAINPGNSGGPLFNAAGELVGINGRGSFEKRGRVNVGVGYAISINQIGLFLNHLKSGRLVDHATLGATVATNDVGEVRVSNILESSDAYLKGLRFDDEILSFANREIRTVNQFKNVLGIFPKGWQVPLTFRRDGKATEIYVRLTGVHPTEQLAEMIQGAVKLPDDTPPGEQPKNPPQAPPEIKKLVAPASKKNKELERWFQDRRGFANFYFNTENQNRVWNQFLSHGDFSKVRQKWRLQVLIDDEPASLILGDHESGLKTSDDAFVITDDNTLGEQLVPSDRGGFLAALHLWRRLLVQGPDRFGDVFYFGETPLVEWTPQTKPEFTNRGKAETLVGTFDELETRFLFNRESGQLEAMEMLTDINSKPCEVHFYGYENHDDLTVPGEIRVVSGREVSFIIKIQQIEFLKSATEVGE